MIYFSFFFKNALYTEITLYIIPENLITADVR